ncbi:MAG: nucleotidyltransferase [Chitinophagales bacterium]|nr:MAG: nucleotidyltransferase [Chitinophagales bacterium]
MKIIVPMAGMGKRMRPHTLTIPKPLIPLAGKPIVQWLVEDISRMSEARIEEIAFVIGDFGSQVEKQLVGIARKLGAKGTLYYQDEPLGTAHAILCASESLSGNLIVAFADTLFRANFKINPDEEGVIWVHKVDNPSSFGVVQLSPEGYINGFVEKPEQFISDLAIIGIYYFRDGAYLKRELQFLIEHDIKDKGEYQLTSALEHMKNKGVKFKPGKVEEWLDCGNKDATVFTHQRVLELHKHENLLADNLVSEDSVIKPPCYIGRNVHIQNSVIGPYVSIGDHSRVRNSVISNSIIQNHTVVEDKIITNSMIGSHVHCKGKMEDVSIGDYTTVK